MPEGGGKLPPRAVRGSNDGGVLCQERHDRDASREDLGYVIGKGKAWDKGNNGEGEIVRRVG